MNGAGPKDAGSFRFAIPAAAKVASRHCKATGGNASFDADLTKAGVQKTGHRSNS
ncbi:MAG TPA: hypothetical protein VJ986_04965 [Gaiellaceae bacterium]|nr:hypothetical protein [Gaiellaceae bacterium]